MSTPSAPKPAALIAGLLLARDFEPERVIEELNRRFGTVEAMSEPTAFSQTTYYDREMGQGIRRCFCLFCDLVDPGRLARIKIETNRIEKELASGENRRVNIDPGLLTANRLVLASGKDAPHRIFLSDGIWAELALIYSSGRFDGLFWTYPDYLDERTLAFFNEARKYYLMTLKRPNGAGTINEESDPCC